MKTTRGKQLRHTTQNPRRDLDDTPAFVKEAINIHFVDHLDQLMPIVLSEEQKGQPVPEFVQEPVGELVKAKASKTRESRKVRVD